jgi:N-methylhydantoinase A
VPRDRRRFKRVLDARYRGQNFEVKVDCDGIGPDGLAELQERFHAAHTKEYGYDIRHRAIQFVSARLQAIGDVPKAPQAEVGGGASLEAALAGSRRVYFDASHGWVDTPIYRRGDLPAETDFSGPAIINEMSATSLVLPGQTVRADRWGNLIVSTNQ